MTEPPVKNGVYWIEATHVYECWFGGEWQWTVTEEEWLRRRPPRTGL